MKVLDLFAGVGGVRMGMESVGFETVYGNDLNKWCKHTYDLNHSDPPLTVANINDVDPVTLPDHDILTGGFPCQPFSAAGLRKGFKDDRGTLFFSIANILDIKKPQAFLLENVKGLVGHDKGKTLRVILKICDDLGYNVKFQVLNSKIHANVPQNRERIFLVGFKNMDTFRNFMFPDPTPLTTMYWDLLEKDVDDKYYIKNKPFYDKVVNHMTARGTAYQWRYNYVRTHMHEGVVPTLVCGGTNPIIIDDNGLRFITPKEAFNLQGFPLDFKIPDISDNHLYRQSGNSVTAPLIGRIAEQMKLAVDRT